MPRHALLLLPLAACAAARRDAPPAAGPPLASYAVAGEYFEATSCRVGCPDMFGHGDSREPVDAIVAFRIVSGNAEGVDLSGRTLAIAASSDRGGKWSGAIFVDDGANARAREALGRIVAERFGGRFESLLPARAVPTEWRREGGRHLLRLGPDAAIAHVEVDGLAGLGGKPVTIANAPGALSPLVHLARSVAARIDDPALGRSWRYEGRNAAFGAFEWRGP